MVLGLKVRVEHLPQQGPELLQGPELTERQGLVLPQGLERPELQGPVLPLGLGLGREQPRRFLPYDFRFDRRPDHWQGFV